VSTFHTDGGGVAFRGSDCKVQCGASTWATRLSQYHRTDAPLLICTYSLPSLSYLQGILAKRPAGVVLLCHSKFRQRASEVVRTLGIPAYVNPYLHAKFVLSGKSTVTIGSANFGDSTWLEVCASFHSADCYEYLRKVFMNILADPETEYLRPQEVPQ